MSVALSEKTFLNKFLVYWLPVLVMITAIIVLSAQPHLKPPLEFPESDKFSHALEYGVLGLLLVRATRASLPGQSAFIILVLGIGLGIVVAAGDEYFQSFVPGRESTAFDWAADVTGLVLGQLIYRWRAMALKHQAPRGTRDLLPEELARWQWAETRARDVLERYGYGEIRTPIFEDYELFARTSGESSDVVQKEMYRFKDLGDRDLALRPEGTAGVCARLPRARTRRHGRIHRLWYMGPMFRYGRPQKGRYRQFYQIGAEIIGIAAPGADVEMIALFVDLFEAWGFSRPDGRGEQRRHAGDAPRVRRALRAVARAGARAAERRFAAAARDEPAARARHQGPEATRAAREARSRTGAPLPRMLDVLDAERRAHWERGARGARPRSASRYEIDHGLVRGLDYYTRTAFEVHDRSLGAQSALGRRRALRRADRGARRARHAGRRILDRARSRDAGARGARRGAAAHATRRGLRRRDGRHARRGASRWRASCGASSRVDCDLEARGFGAQMKAAGKSGRARRGAARRGRVEARRGGGQGPGDRATQRSAPRWRRIDAAGCEVGLSDETP